MFFLNLLAAGVVLFLPGWACLACLSNDQWARRDLLERLADAAGLSIALTALVGMAGFFMGLRLPAAGIIELYGLSLVVLLLASGRSGLKSACLRSGKGLDCCFWLRW